MLTSIFNNVGERGFPKYMTEANFIFHIETREPIYVRNEEDTIT